MSRICIGMPVYNGERFIAAAIESILAQTYDDFHLVISDNASTDSTPAICQRYVADDSRVTYLRNERNIGAAQNHNHVFSLNGSRYFKWAAHDDVLAPTYLEKCIHAMDRSPDVVLCHTRVQIVDEAGNHLRDYESPLRRTMSPRSATRFADFVLEPHACFDIYGVFRSCVLSQTSCIGNHLSSDRVLLAELALLGRIHVIPEPLFFSRDHSSRSVRIPLHQRVREWWSQPGQERRFVFPHWRVMLEYLRVANKRSQGVAERIACCRIVLAWAVGHRRHLGHDIKIAAFQVANGLRAIALRMTR